MTTNCYKILLYFGMYIYAYLCIFVNLKPEQSSFAAQTNVRPTALFLKEKGSLPTLNKGLKPLVWKPFARLKFRVDAVYNRPFYS